MSKVIYQVFKDIYNEGIAKDAIINDGHTGFREDYLVLHCLLRQYKPKTFLEIGTNMGVGTSIICNALGKEAKMYSLDLPDELASLSLQHPINGNNGNGAVGKYCKFPYTQLFGDSLVYDYKSIYPIEGWWIDGEHTERNVFNETMAALDSNAKIIIYHDSDMSEVFSGIQMGFDTHKEGKNYELYRVKDTRIAYAIRK